MRMVRGTLSQIKTQAMALGHELSEAMTDRAEISHFYRNSCRQVPWLSSSEWEEVRIESKPTGIESSTIQRAWTRYRHDPMYYPITTV